MKLFGVFRDVALVLLGGSLAGQAFAAGCSISSSGLAFGLYQPFTFAGKRTSVDNVSDAVVSLACTGISGAGSYTIALGPSIAGNSIYPRYLANSNGGTPMVFNIYRDPGYSVIWGDGVTGDLLSGSIPAGDSFRQHTVYGRAPAGQSALKAGSFHGILNITVTYSP